MKRIPLLVPDLPPHASLRPYLERIDAARWYTNFGPLSRELEARLAAAFVADGTVHAVSVANGTLGLEIALLALGLPRGARVLVPALTFVASAAAVLRAGHQPVLCDVDPGCWILTPAIARTALAASGAQAVMPVATYGVAQDVDAWDRFSAETGVPVVIDAAGAWGNQSRAGRSMAVFSMHATKTLAAAEGGFIVCTDARLLEEARRLSNFGISLPSGIVPGEGTNAKLSEYHAAIGLASLERWPQRRELRIALHRRYLDRLRSRCPRLVLQSRPDEGVYSILPVCLPEPLAAAAVAARLAEQGIETRRWYCPTLPHHPAFATAARAGTLTVSEALSERLLALPFHVFLDDTDLDTVCAALAALLPAP